MAASPSTANIRFNPGVLRYAPLGTTEPTGRLAAWPAGWTQIGYTREGHTQTHGLNIEDAEVAELLDPVLRVTTRRDSRVAFAAAEVTIDHVKVFLNGGTTAADGADGEYYEPPQVGAEVRIMLGWDSNDGLERIIWRKVIQAGNVEIPRRKGADYATLTGEFALEPPSGGAAPFRWFFATALS